MWNLRESIQNIERSEGIFVNYLIWFIFKVFFISFYGHKVKLLLLFFLFTMIIFRFTVLFILGKKIIFVPRVARPSASAPTIISIGKFMREHQLNSISKIHKRMENKLKTRKKLNKQIANLPATKLQMLLSRYRLHRLGYLKLLM